MKNRIVCSDGAKESPCLICGAMSKHFHYEKKNRENSAAICNDCCAGPVDIEVEVIEYVCPECGDVKNPVNGPGGLKVCPNNFCGEVVRKKA